MRSIYITPSLTKPAQCSPLAMLLPTCGMNSVQWLPTSPTSQGQLQMMERRPMNFGININHLSLISRKLVVARLRSSPLIIPKYIIVPPLAHLLDTLPIQRCIASGIDPVIAFSTLFIYPSLNRSKLRFLPLPLLVTSQQILHQNYHPQH